MKSKVLILDGLTFALLSVACLYHLSASSAAESVVTSQALGYYRLGGAQTVLVPDQPWETIAPHTLSVVQMNSRGYTYWGYYGINGCAGVGLAWSNDLVHWTKYSGNPLFSNARWPSVLKVGGLFYMLYEKDFCTTSYINLATSTDGIAFTDLKTIVRPQPGIRNQNPNLFYNPNDGKYYIYWYRGDEATTWDINARSATTIANLDDAASEVTVIHSTSRLASPNVLYYNNTYFLPTEVKDSNNQWNVRVYASAFPTRGFYILPGNPVLGNGSACLFQFVIGDRLHTYYCKTTSSGWTGVDYRTADLAAGRIQFRDPGKWIIKRLLPLLVCLISLALWSYWQF